MQCIRGLSFYVTGYMKLHILLYMDIAAHQWWCDIYGTPASNKWIKLLVTNNFKFEWGIDSGEIRREENDKNDIGIHEIIKIENCQEITLPEVD